MLGHGVKYSQPRNDPIFPAATEDVVSAGPPRYIHNDTIAGVLGCVDEIQICGSVHGPCWTYANMSTILHDIRLSSKLENSSDEISEKELLAYFLRNSLSSSTAYDAIKFRKSQSLTAQAKLANGQSLMLPERQWHVEVEKIFQASLARIQLDAFDISRGTARAFSDYHDMLPAEYRGICRLMSIQSQGYRNTNTMGLFGTLIGIVFIWSLGWRKLQKNYTHELNAYRSWNKVLRRPCVWIKDMVITIVKTITVLTSSTRERAVTLTSDVQDYYARQGYELVTVRARRKGY